MPGGGKLIIDYDTGRLPNYRRQRREAVFWQVQIFCKISSGWPARSRITFGTDAFGRSRTRYRLLPQTVRITSAAGRPSD